MIDWKLRSSGMGFMGREFETANSRQFNMDMIPKTANSYGIVGDMERGLTRGEFLFVYQPRLRSGETKISGFDVLMRWRHPVDGLLEPSALSVSWTTRGWPAALPIFCLHTQSTCCR